MTGTSGLHGKRALVIARIPASDDDGDRIRGLFFAGHEVQGTTEWQVRDGRLVRSPSPATNSGGA